MWNMKGIQKEHGGIPKIEKCRIIIRKFEKTLTMKKTTDFILNAEQQQLVIEHQKLALNLARQYREMITDPAITVQDLEQEAFLGLREAAYRFTPDRKVGFLTYAYNWCYKYIKMALSRKVAHSCEVDVDGMCDDSVLDDEEETIQALMRQEEIYCRLKRAIAKLENIERQVVIFRYGLQGSQLSVKETAKKLSLSPRRVLQIHGSAMYKLEMSL